MCENYQEGPIYVDEIPEDPYKFDGKSRKTFMKTYSLTGRIADACDAVGISTTYIYQRRKIDDELATEMEAAYDTYRASIEAEIHRRAITGVTQKQFHQGSPIVDYELDEDGQAIKDENGDVITHHAVIRRFSDTLLLAHARRHIPEYNEKRQVDMKVSGLEGLLDEIRPSTGLPSEDEDLDSHDSKSVH